MPPKKMRSSRSFPKVIGPGVLPGHVRRGF
jgi:hypothetical protein